MCDYSLHLVASRPAKVGDKLVTMDFAGSSTRGFSAVGAPDVAVCLLPGTEIAFEQNVRVDPAFAIFGRTTIRDRVARFRQVNVNDPYVHHDALEFPSGKIVLVTRLAPNQKATVLQLPAMRPRKPRTDSEMYRAALEEALTGRSSPTLAHGVRPRRSVRNEYEENGNEDA